MNELKIFENTQFGQLKVVEHDGEPWFVGKDVAEILGYSNSSKAVMMHVDDEDKCFEMLPIKADSQNATPSGMTKTALINESGLYSLVLRSNLPAAKQFKRWVTSEVLPAIRKTGGSACTPGTRMIWSRFPSFTAIFPWLGWSRWKMAT